MRRQQQKLHRTDENWIKHCDEQSELCLKMAAGSNATLSFLHYSVILVLLFFSFQSQSLFRFRRIYQKSRMCVIHKITFGYLRNFCARYYYGYKWIFSFSLYFTRKMKLGSFFVDLFFSAACSAFAVIVEQKHPPIQDAYQFIIEPIHWQHWCTLHTEHVSSIEMGN